MLPPPSPLPDRLTRRNFFGALLAGAALILGTGHTPYGQWAVYRKRYLLVLTSRGDPPGYALGKQVVAVLATHLPASKARIARAPYTARIASLISTKQMDMALMIRREAAALLKGEPPFVDYGPVPLRAIAGLGDHVLVTRDDFPDRHAYLVAETLSVNRGEIAVAFSPAASGGDADATVPTHPGARAYYDGKPPPEAEASAKQND